MPRINIGDGELTGPDGKPVKVKVIEAESIDGVVVSIMVPESAAKDMAAALDSRTIKVAGANEMPPTPEADDE